MAHLVAILPIFIIFLFRKKYSPVLLNPTSVLCITWLTFLILHLLFASDYYYSYRVSLLILFFVFSFSLGEILIVANYNFRNLPNLGKPRFYSVYFKSRLKLVIIILTFISATGFILYLNTFIDYFGSFQKLASSGDTIRTVVKIIYIPLFVKLLLLLGYSAAILCLIYYITNGFRWFIVIPFIIIFLMGAVHSGRAGFIMLIVFIFFAIYWRDLFKNAFSGADTSVDRRLIIRTGVFVLFSIIVFVLGYMQRREDFSFHEAFSKDALQNFKVYLLGGISAFEAELKSPELLARGFGKYNFSALYDLLGIAKNEFGVYTLFYPVSAAPGSPVVNIFTSFRPLIDDFGIIGGGIFMFLLGGIGGIAFNKAMNGSLPYLAFLIVLYGYLFHTPLLPITVHTSIVLCFFVPSVLIEIIRIGFKKIT
jgi:oligosaccharide repeat unit polymerase